MNFIELEAGREVDFANLWMDSVVNNCYSKYELDPIRGEITLSDLTQFSLSGLESLKSYALPAEIVLIHLGQPQDKAHIHAVLVVSHIEDFLSDLKQFSDKDYVVIKTDREIQEIESKKTLGSVSSTLVVKTELITFIPLSSKVFKGSWDDREFKEDNVFQFPSRF